MDFLWTFCGLSVDKIPNFAGGFTKKQKVHGKSTKSPQKSMEMQKSMESMESIWNRWGSVKTSASVPHVVVVAIQEMSWTANGFAPEYCKRILT